MNLRSQIVRWLMLVGSVSLFGASLYFPALMFADHTPESGAQVLMWGWWGLLTSDFAWFANPAFFLAVIAMLVRRWGLAQLLAVLAFVLGATSLDAKAWWFDEGQGTPIVALGDAFILWMASFAVLFLGSWATSWLSDGASPSGEAGGK